MALYHEVVMDLCSVVDEHLSCNNLIICLIVLLSYPCALYEVKVEMNVHHRVRL